MPTLGQAVIGRRMVQGMTQCTRPHGGTRIVQHAEQRGRFGARLATYAQRFGQFQIASRDAVHAQVLVRPLDLHAADAEHVGFAKLCGLDVIEQGATGRECWLVLMGIDAEGGERAHLERVTECARTALGVEEPIGTPGCLVITFGPCRTLGNQNFRWIDTAEQGTELRDGNLGQRQTAGGQRHPGGAHPSAARKKGHEMALASLIHECRVANSAGRHNACHGALDRAFRGGRIADLFADGDGFTGFDETGDVLIGGVKRHTGHANRFTVGLAAAGQGDVEQTRGFDRVVKEQLIKVAHPIKEQGIGHRRF